MAMAWAEVAITHGEFEHFPLRDGQGVEKRRIGASVAGGMLKGFPISAHQAWHQRRLSNFATFLPRKLV